MTFRFGAITLPNQPWPELRARWTRLDEQGVDSIWTCDHLSNPYRMEPWFEGVTTLTALAMSTARATVGALVFSMTIRNPAVLAKAAVTVDHVSDGRVELAVGTAGSPWDYALLQAADQSPRQRADAFGAWVDRLTAVLDDDGLAPRPVRGRLPLMIAAHGSKALDAVARHGDAWNAFGLRGGDREANVAWFEAMGGRLDARLAAVGRAPGAVRRSALLDFTPGTSWTTAAEFEQLAHDLVGAGVDEVITYEPLPVGASPAFVVDREEGAFDAVLADVVPRLREAYP